MFKFLDRYFIKEFFKVFCFIIFCLFPIVFFADLFLHGSFSFKSALSKIIYRYTCLLSSLLLLSIYLTVKKIINQHSKLCFFSLGCGKLVAIKSLVFITFIVSLLYYFVVLPSNDYFFQQINFVSNWRIVKNRKNEVFYLYKYNGKSLSFIYKTNGILDLKQHDFSQISKNKFDILWVDPNKMSIQTLNLCLKFYEQLDWNNSQLVKQKYIFLSKIFIFFMLLLLGYSISLDDNLILQIFILFLVNWIEILLFFLTLKYCIILLCLECVFCMLLSIYFLV